MADLHPDVGSAVKIFPIFIREAKIKSFPFNFLPFWLSWAFECI